MSSPRPVLWTPSFALACAANFLLGMSFYVLMPTLPFHLMDELGVDEAVAGAILASYVIAALLVRPFSGFIVDHVNAKHAYLVALGAYVLCTAGYLWAATVAAFVFVRIGIGLTFAILSTASNTQAIDIIPSSRRGEGIGYFGLMSSLAMAMGPMAGLWLMDHYPFAVLFDVAVGAGAGGLALASLVRSPAKQRASQSAVLSLDRFLLVRGIPLAINLALIGLAYGMLLAFAALYGKQVGAQSTGLFFTLMALGMMVSRTFSGRLLDAGHVVAVTNGGTAAIVLGLMVMVLLPGQVPFYLSGMLIGAGFGIVYPAYQTMMVNMGSHAQRGTAVATYFTALDVGIGAGMVVAGLIAARYGLSAAFAGGALLVLLAGSMFALVLSRRIHVAAG
jgi:predicted MFS family arabinose efflux permease